MSSTRQKPCCTAGKALSTTGCVLATLSAAAVVTTGIIIARILNNDIQNGIHDEANDLIDLVSTPRIIDNVKVSIPEFGDHFLEITIPALTTVFPNLVQSINSTEAIVSTASSWLLVSMVTGDLGGIAAILLLIGAVSLLAYQSHTHKREIRELKNTVTQLQDDINQLKRRSLDYLSVNTSAEELSDPDETTPLVTLKN